MTFKRVLMDQGMKLASDPRVMKLMQDPRVMNAMMQAFQLRQKAQESIDSKVATVAKSLNLATKEELRELKRTIRKLETELEKAKKAGG